MVAIVVLRGFRSDRRATREKGKSNYGIVKLRLAAVFDAQHGGFATG
jgi:hypothetical protein